MDGKFELREVDLPKTTGLLKIQLTGGTEYYEFTGDQGEFCDWAFKFIDAEQYFNRVGCRIFGICIDSAEPWFEIVLKPVPEFDDTEDLVDKGSLMLEFADTAQKNGRQGLQRIYRGMAKTLLETADDLAQAHDKTNGKPKPSQLPQLSQVWHKEGPANRGFVVELLFNMPHPLWLHYDEMNDEYSAATNLTEASVFASAEAARGWCDLLIQQQPKGVLSNGGFMRWRKDPKDHLKVCPFEEAVERVSADLLERGQLAFHARQRTKPVLR